MTNQPDAWLRGPVPGIVPELAPLAHALIQAREDIVRATAGVGAAELWLRPGGAASAGFHLKHAAGALDRLMTYARGEQLSAAQRAALADERTEGSAPAVLVERVLHAIEDALAQLARTQAAELDAERTIGKAALPATARGALFHAAEHLSRHTGQCITTLRVVRGLGLPGA